MEERELKKKALIERIDSLVDESCHLPRDRNSWDRHIAIQLEIMQLCKQTANLFKSEVPYWAMEDNNSKKAERSERLAS